MEEKIRGVVREDLIEEGMFELKPSEKSKN